MRTELPVEPVVDSPVFRASLTALDAKATAVRKTCKNVLQAAQSVRDLLEKLELAESELFDSLDQLRRQIIPVEAKGFPGGVEQTGIADSVVRDLKAWKVNERTEERQRLEVLVTSRVKALKVEMKAKGVGAGGILNTFEVRMTIPESARSSSSLPGPLESLLSGTRKISRPSKRSPERNRCISYPSNSSSSRIRAPAIYRSLATPVCDSALQSVMCRSGDLP